MNLTVCKADFFILEEIVAEKTKVTRVTAKDDAPVKAASKASVAKKTTAKATKVVKKDKTPKEPKQRNGFMRALARIGGYFKGAWVELKQVRWPTRKATWGLTLAVILFSAFFVVLILLLDALFQYLFDFIIG